MTEKEIFDAVQHNDGITCLVPACTNEPIRTNTVGPQSFCLGHDHLWPVDGMPNNDEWYAWYKQYNFTMPYISLDWCIVR